MIVLVQYGETEASQEKIVPKQFYDELTQNGMDAAYQYSEALAGIRFDHSFSNNNFAASASCAAILPYRPRADTIHTEDLYEPHAGDYEGRSYAELKRLLPPREYRLWDRDMFSSPPEGESLAEVSERVLKFYRDQIEPKQAENVLIVVGPMVMKILLGHLQALEEADMLALAPISIPYMFDR